MDNSQLGNTTLKVSPIGLGTVEIGIPGYGVGKDGLISEQEAHQLLKTAVDMGVTYIDTARGYGVAEERIGTSGITKHENVIVGTKCAQFLKEQPDMHGEELENAIREEIDESRRLLGYETLPLVQIHLELPDYTDLRELIEIMQNIKDEEKVRHVGIATRGENVPIAAIESGFFETIQTAYSILDQRMAPTVLPKAREANVGVINRSVLLKGALTPARTNLPPELQPLKTNADKAQQLAQQAGTDLPSLALRFCLSHNAVSTALIGTTKPERIESAMKATQEGPLKQDLLNTLYGLAINDPEQVDPARWPK